MDLPVPPNPVSEYSETESGACFTVHSASSPSYSLIRRAGLRRPTASARDRDTDKTADLTERDRWKEGPQGTCFPQKKPGTNEDVSGNETSNISICKNKQTSDANVSHQMIQNGVESKMTLSGDHCISWTKVATARGRTEWRGETLPSRSKSLDGRGWTSSPDQGSRSRVLVHSDNKACLDTRRAGSLERGGLEARDRGVVTEGRVMSTVHFFKSGGTADVCGEKSLVEQFASSNVVPRLRHSGQALEQSGWGQSLPSRLRPQSFPGSGIRDTSTSFGPGGGQSIWERIERLYGSMEPSKMEESVRTKHHSAPLGDCPEFEGEGQATIGRGERSSPSSPFSTPIQRGSRLSYEGESGGTFPRHLSKVERNSLSLQKNGKPVTSLPPSDNKYSGNPEDSVHFPMYTRQISPGLLRQGKAQAGPLEEGDIHWDRGVVEMGTRSLDRARSKNTIAARIRAARVTGIMPSSITQPCVEEKTPSTHTDGRPSRSKDESGTDKIGFEGEITDGTSCGLRPVELEPRSMEPKEEKEKEYQSDGRIIGEKKMEGNGMKSGSLCEDVFESGALKIILRTTERRATPEKPLISSTASVRNKIHQFEALAQRAMGSASGQFLAPRRAFSVPAQPSRVTEGVKKSASGKELGGLREKWVGLKEGVRSCNKTREEGKMLEDNLGRERGDVFNRIQIEKLNDDKKAQRGSNQMSVDELGIRSNEREIKEVFGSDNNREDVFGNYSTQNDELGILLNGETKRSFCIDETDGYSAACPEQSSKKSSSFLHAPELSGAQSRSPPDSSSPVIDKDKTPTNTPHNSPFLSHRTHSTPRDEGGGGSPSGSSEGTDPSSEGGSRRSLVDLVPPLASDPRRGGRKQEKNLVAWVASLNQEIEGWSDDDDDKGTEKDEDSNYDSDSDSADSSVTVTSNMSQSDRRSFCMSLADLCNFSGIDYESESDSEELLPNRRSASMSSDISAFSYVSVLPSEELERLLEDVRGIEESSLQNYNDVQVVVLHKDVGVGLGFSLAGGVDQNKPITVHKVFPSGAAAHEGSIREGDRVLSINGTALCSSGHSEAIRTLRRAKARAMGVVVLRRGGVCAPSKERVGIDAEDGAQTQSRDTGQRVCVQLEKQSRDLGFSLEGGVGASLGDRPLSIQKVFQGGPVNQVCPGDELVEIQGVSTVGMRRLEAWTLIRGLPPGPVDVILHRRSTV